MYLARAKIVYGKNIAAPANRRHAAPLGDVEPLDLLIIKEMSVEDREKVRSIEICFDSRDIPRDEGEYHKNTVIKKAGERGFWSLPKPERMHRLHDKYQEEIIKIWIAKFQALDAFRLDSLQFDIRLFSCEGCCCMDQDFLEEVGNLLPMLKNPLPKDITILADDDEMEELLRSILSTHSPEALA